MPLPSTTTRVITGEWRNRVITLPQGDHVRPTRNMVLQAGFNILGARTGFANIHVADVCCGSGQWGIECLSRGAAHVDFVDLETQMVMDNLLALSADGARFRIHSTSVKTLSTPLTDRDLIIADPPYDAAGLYDFILQQHMWGKSGTLWLFETGPLQHLTPPSHLELLSHKRYGNSALWLFQQR